MPERPTTPQADENEIFFDNLTAIKQANNEVVMAGGTVVDGGSVETQRPDVYTPSMEEFKEEIRINEEIKSEQEQAWTTWRENRAFQLVGYGAIAYVAYSMFLK